MLIFGSRAENEDSLTILLSILLYPIIYLLAILPFRILYLFSDIAYLIGYRIFGYRTGVVDKNLSLVFPNKSTSELIKIRNQFYRNFFDIIFETIKMLVLPQDKIKDLLRKGQTGPLDKYYGEQQSAIIASSHLGNWEYGSVAHERHYPGVSKGVYKPLSNKFFDQLMLRLRSRFGVEMVGIDDTLQMIRDNMDNHIVVGLLSDQNPSSHNALWLPFFGIETPVYTGLELLAKRFNLPVVYVRWDRIKRGRYEMNCELITDNPKTEEKYHITKVYLEKMERDIELAPDNWLWTHNRWKRVKAKD